MALECIVIPRFCSSSLLRIQSNPRIALDREREGQRKGPPPDREREREVGDKEIGASFIVAGHETDEPCLAAADQIRNDLLRARDYTQISIELSATADQKKDLEHSTSVPGCGRNLKPPQKSSSAIQNSRAVQVAKLARQLRRDDSIRAHEAIGEPDRSFETRTTVSRARHQKKEARARVHEPPISCIIVAPQTISRRWAGQPGEAAAAQPYRDGFLPLGT